MAGTIGFLSGRKDAQTVEALLKLSRLPRNNPKTFDNFRFDELKGKDAQVVRGLSSLAPIYARKNLAFIGPPGTGKTHLAMAFGYECCRRKIKAYFIKMSELKDRFSRAIQARSTAVLLDSLVKPSCLIIDEVGHCVLDRQETVLFFDLVDRRYNKEGPYNMVFTSNKQPSAWRSNFSDDDSLLCSLDRLFDDVMVFNLNGSSHRGAGREEYSVRTSGSKDQFLPSGSHTSIR